jgi:hypothetical protein
MKISYLITCRDEGTLLYNLIKRLEKGIDIKQDEVVIIYDAPELGKFSKTDTEGVLLNVKAIEEPNVKVLCHELSSDYGAHKNWGNKQCTGEFIFQIDGDELPPENILGDNLKAIIELNPNVDLVYVPRINDFKGVTEEHAKPWGWRLTPSPSCDNRLVVNWPDYQGRIYRNATDRIKWDRKLHEKIEGHNEYSFLPAEEEYALYHDKTIEKQIETNMRYNKVFTEDENRGHKIT